MSQRPREPDHGGERTGTSPFDLTADGRLADERTLYACAAPDFNEAARKAAREARLLAFRVPVPAF